jgi:hypothetical protein
MSERFPPVDRFGRLSTPRSEDPVRTGRGGEKECLSVSRPSIDSAGPIEEVLLAGWPCALTDDKYVSSAYLRCFARVEHVLRRKLLASDFA